jgi:hypothetical protein
MWHLLTIGYYSVIKKKNIISLAGKLGTGIHHVM